MMERHWQGRVTCGAGVALALWAVMLPAGPGRAQQPPASPAPAMPCPINPDALGTARVLTFDPASLPPVGLKTYPRSLDLADHEVVLTFDDGPSRGTTPRVLAALEHECVRAAFFLIGRNAQAAPALVRREIADGDLVGNHSWSHPLVTERGLPEALARDDIAHGFAAVDKAGYGTAAGAPRVPVFRFPGFGDSPALLAWLKERHVAVFGTDLWASDWEKQTPQAELELLMGRLDKAGRGIILLHDIKDQTAAMLPAFLAALKAGRYRVVALALGPAGPPPVRPAPAGWSSETEATLDRLRIGIGPKPLQPTQDDRPIGAPAQKSGPTPDEPLLPGEP